ncbi:MAG: hypothetical protein IKI38_05600, partial [Mogibacterium sp.]|nr:hypothetical protein [Mogibacterium sp.]
DVMYATEMLANLEGLERGPAGNTALAAAFSLAQELPEDAVIVISETEYTGAGKHIQPQLTFARENGIEIRFGDPKEDIPGKNIILPEDAILVVSETEYTGAGKHVQPQLWFAKENGIEVKLGDPKDEVPGKSVVLPSSPALFKYKEADINHFRQSLIKKAVKKAGVKPTDSDLEFLAEETKTDVEFVKKTLEENGLL